MIEPGDSAILSSRTPRVTFGGGEDRGLEQIRELSAVNPLQGELALADFNAERNKFAQPDAECESILQSSFKAIEAHLEAAD